MVYLLHFDEHYHHARHYVGYVDGGQEALEARIKLHKSGAGARLMQVISEAGIDFEVARVWPEGDRSFERRIKNMKKASKYCPICRQKLKASGEVAI